jgi:hypothetical protein
VTRLIIFIVLVLGSTLAAVLLPVLAVWIWTADLFITLWRYLTR